MTLFTEILPQLSIYLLIALSATGVILGDYSAKTWSVNQQPLWLVLAFVGYLISSFFYIPSLFKEGLIITSLLWELLSLLGFLFIGFVIFKESLNSWQIGGAILGIVALFMLALGNR